MIYHCIRFTVKPDVPEEDRTTALELMRQATGRIPAVKSWILGRDFGGEYEYAAVSVIEDLEGYEEMMNHPAHLEVDRLGMPMVDRFVSYDVTDDPDPEMGARIAEVHRRRYESTPDLAELVAGLDEYSGSAAPGEHGQRG